MRGNMDQRLLTELFEKKVVPQSQELYRRLYSVIWPCERYYRDFLRAGDSSVKLSCAKKIYAYERAEADFFLPESLLNALIAVQQTELVAGAGGYIPQDHVIHAISLYILGIYLFFNLPALQCKLMPSSRDGLMSLSAAEEEFLSFLFKWRVFSLYHDVGYVLELLTTNKKKETREAKNLTALYGAIRRDFLHECACRSVSRTIIGSFVLTRSESYFHLPDIGIADTEWRYDHGQRINPDKVEVRLNEFFDSRRIEFIFSPMGIRHILPFIGDQPLLTVVTDRRFTLLAFVIWKQDETWMCWRDGKIDVDTLSSIAHHTPITSDAFKCRYYIRNPEACIKRMYEKCEFSSFADDAVNYSSQLPRRLGVKLSLVEDDTQINQAYHDIYNWLKEETVGRFSDPARQIGADESYKIHAAPYYKQALIDRVERHVKTYMADKQATADNLEDHLNKLLREIADEDPTEIINDAMRRYAREEGSASNILYYFCVLYSHLYRNGKGRVEKTGLTDRVENRITLHAFRVEKGDSLAEQLYQAVNDRAKEVGLSLEYLKAYSPNYAAFDHGVVAASVLFHVAAFYRRFTDERWLKMYKPFRLTWYHAANVEKLTGNEAISAYAEIIFAVLIHNVYTKGANPQYGLDYSQNIEKNPFSYFCALADLLQKWSRPKQIDFSVLDLPKDHFLDNEYDIQMVEGKILLSYRAFYSGILRAEIDRADDYLPGIKELIQIDEAQRTDN